PGAVRTVRHLEPRDAESLDPPRVPHVVAGCEGRLLVECQLGEKAGEVDQTAAFSRIWMAQAEPRPITCVRPTLAPSTWRAPASPRRWVVTSKRLATPVAPSGWPFEMSPPETLTGIFPSRRGPPES